MTKEKKHVKYQGVSLPIPFINDIKKHISKDNRYTTVPGYVRQAVREKMDRDMLKDKEVLELLNSEIKNLQEHVVRTDGKGNVSVISADEADKLVNLPTAKRESAVPLTKEVYEYMDELIKRHVRKELKKVKN